MAKRRSEPPSPEGSFEEAIAWHRQKLAVRKEDWAQLETRAQKRAFTAAGVARLDVLDDVMKAIDKALADGETMEDFKKRVQAKLEKEWGGEIPGRIENIFRTNVQHAYSHGRYSQLEDPDLMVIRPFRRFTAVMDLRTTTEICRPLNGTILAASDPWWRTHLPPLHFQCRSAIISLRRSVAIKAGVTAKPPTVEAQQGFGSAVGYEWKPDLAAKDRKLVEIYRRQQKTDQPKPPDEKKDSGLATAHGEAVERYFSPKQRELTPAEHRIRDIARGLKTNDAKAIEAAAEEMAPFVPKGAVLVPLPSSSGTTTSNQLLIDAILKRLPKDSEVESRDVLRGTPRESQYTRRRSGKKGLEASDIGTFKVGEVPEERPVVLIDNIRTTGATIDASRKLLPGSRYLVYAQADEVIRAPKS